MMAKLVPPPMPIRATMPTVPIRPKWNLGPRLRGLGALTPTQKGLLATAVVGAVFVGGILWLWKK